LNERTFDLDIRVIVYLDPIYVKVKGRGYKTKFTVTG